MSSDGFFLVLDSRIDTDYYAPRITDTLISFENKISVQDIEDYEVSLSAIVPNGADAPTFIPVRVECSVVKPSYIGTSLCPLLRLTELYYMNNNPTYVRCASGEHRSVRVDITPLTSTRKLPANDVILVLHFRKRLNKA